MSDQFTPENMVEYKLMNVADPTQTATYIRAGSGAVISFSNGKGRTYEEDENAWLHGWEWLAKEGYRLVDTKGDKGEKIRELLTARLKNRAINNKQG